MVLLASDFFWMGLRALRPPFLVLEAFLRRLRRAKGPECPKGCTTMKLAEPEPWLTPLQLTEIRIGSFDHDLWRCGLCHAQLVTTHRRWFTSYAHCYDCGAQAVLPYGRRILQLPTRHSTGQGEESSLCHHCGKDTYRTFVIPRYSR